MFQTTSWILSLSIMLLMLESTQVNSGFTLEQGIPHFNTKPYFLPSSTQNITALQGQSAYIHCRVAQLGDKKVSWIRGRDLHVLTSGLISFASDQRFQSVRPDRSENWTLHIRYSQARDTGEYQCQINSEPKISQSFYLNIIEATTKISGSTQRYVKAGSTLQLSCETSASSPQPGLLYWYRDTELLNEKKNVRILNTFEDSIKSELLIDNAQESDSGNYTCWPTKFLPNSVMVHVIRDEEPAAMSHGTVSAHGGGTLGTKTPTNKTEVKSPNINILGVILVFKYILVNYLEPR